MNPFEVAQLLSSLSCQMLAGAPRSALPKSSGCNISSLAFGADWFAAVSVVKHFRKQSFAASTLDLSFSSSQGKPHGQSADRSGSGPRRER